MRNAQRVLNGPFAAVPHVLRTWPSIGTDDRLHGVTHIHCGLIGVAVITQRLCVALHVGSALAQGNDVVSLRGNPDNPTLFTLHA